MRSLSGQNIPNTDKSNPTDYPYDRAKDASQNANDGTPLLESTTITDVSYAMYHVMRQANIQPDENPENINNSQFFDAMMRLFGCVGSIVLYQGTPPVGSRMLLIEGQVINLAEPKYKYLKEWVIQNKTISLDLFHEEGQRLLDAVTPFRIKASDENYLRLPKYDEDNVNLPLIMSTLPYLMGLNNEGGAVGHHYHPLDNNVTIPAHTHAVTDNGHIHNRGDMEITGLIGNVHNAQGNATPTEGAFFTSEVRERTGPVNASSNVTSNVNFEASRGWKGNTSSSYSGISINPTKDTVANLTGNTGVNPTNNSTKGKNLAAGILVRPYLRY